MAAAAWAAWAIWTFKSSVPDSRCAASGMTNAKMEGGSGNGPALFWWMQPAYLIGTERELIGAGEAGWGVVLLRWRQLDQGREALPVRHLPDIMAAVGISARGSTEQARVEARRMEKVASLFSGLGGLDLGLETAGWDCVYASDIDRHAVESLKANRAAPLASDRRFMSEGHIEIADVRAVEGTDILAKAGERRGGITLLAGGPPCQSWSSAGHQLGFDDPRGQLIKDYLRIAAELDCRYLLFENVRGLVTARGPDGIPGSALTWLREQLFARGWQTHVELFNAADYGMPSPTLCLLSFASISAIGRFGLK